MNSRRARKEWSEEEYIAYRDFYDARTDEKGRRNNLDRHLIDKNGNYIKKGQMNGSDKGMSSQKRGKGQVDDEDKQLDRVDIDELDGPYDGSALMASTGHEAAQILTKDKLERIVEKKSKELRKYDAEFT